MKIDDLIGSWKNYDKGPISYAVTTYKFQSDSTYSKYVESSTNLVSPLGSITNSSTSEDHGMFMLYGDKIMLFSNKNS